MADHKPPGGVAAKMLKLEGAPLVHRLVVLCNAVLDEGALPNGWRRGNLTSLYDTSACSNPNNCASRCRRGICFTENFRPREARLERLNVC